MAFDKIRKGLKNVVVRGALKHAPDSTIAKVIGDLYPYKDTATYRRVPAEPLDRTAVLSEIAGMAAQRGRARRQGHRLRQPLLWRPRPLPLPGRGVRPVLARQRAAARHVPERHQVRGRDHRHGERPAARHWGGRRHERRHREPDHRPVLLPRARPRQARRHQTERRHAGDRPRRPRQGRPLDGHRGAQDAAHRALRRRRGGDGRADRRPDHRARRQRGRLRSRPHRPHRRDRGARAVARHRPARRRLPRRLAAALGGASRLRRAALGLQGARRDLDLGRHAQVRLRAEGFERAALPRQGHAPAAVLRLPGLARWSLPVAGLRRLAQRRHPGLDVGGAARHRRVGLPGRGRRHHADGDHHPRRRPRDPRARGDGRPPLPGGLQVGRRPRHLPGERRPHRPGLAHERGAAPARPALLRHAAQHGAGRRRGLRRGPARRRRLRQEAQGRVGQVGRGVRLRRQPQGQRAGHVGDVQGARRHARRRPDGKAS